MYDPVDSSGPDKRFHHWGQDLGSARYFIDCFTNEGDIVLDPFCGGGTTPVVCQAIGRKYIAFDCDPLAIETTCARLHNPYFLPASPLQLRLGFAINTAPENKK
jgi:site-specific DNA-methyltransferase (adenine-specific)